MDKIKHCTGCGAVMPSDSPAGHCLKCLLELAFARDDTAKMEQGDTIKLDLPADEVDGILGSRIGHYKILQQLGEGGCGVVYMAEQTEPVRRRVALKVIKPGMDSRQVLARFEAERQALALMDHPNIAKVLDAGATEQGRPYFVMELVKGIPITRYCDEKQLDTRERLKLFTQVCQAIQHAHQKGIIHRDIKPSNILVTDHDGTPVPKVIDFGIAKATTDQRLTDKTLFTAFEQFMGTPAYMSPEQASLSGLDIDTRSDIYSLGVLLYELLTGRTPFDARELLAKGLDEIRRVIREVEPQRPSTRLSTLDAGEQTTIAKLRQAEAPKLLGLIRGDLDWIVMKALEKDRARRYETANGFAADILRHLNDEPVVARPPSNLYRLQKMARRNKVVFAAASVVLVSLIISLGIAIWSLQKQKQATQRVVTEAVKSQQVSTFLTEMLNGVGPSAAMGRDTTMLREILDKSATRIEKDLMEQPEAKAELLTIIADVYQDVDRFVEAEKLHRAALAIRQKLWGNQHPAVARSLEGIGRALWKSHRLTAAEETLRECLAMRRQLHGNSHPDVAAALNSLGRVLSLERKNVEAEAGYREALAILRSASGDHESTIISILGNHSAELLRLNRPMEAEPPIREALSRLERRPLSIGHAHARETLARVLHAQKRLVESEQAYREAQSTLKVCLGDDGFGIGYNAARLAALLADMGKWDEADGYYRETIRIWLKPADRGDVRAQIELQELTPRLRRFADRLRAAGLPEKAASWEQEIERVEAAVISACRKKTTEGHPEDMNRLAWLLMTTSVSGLRNETEALDYALKGVAASRRLNPECLDTLAMVYAGVGQFTNAVAAQTEAMRLLKTDLEKKDYAERLKLYQSNQTFGLPR